MVKYKREKQRARELKLYFEYKVILLKKTMLSTRFGDLKTILIKGLLRTNTTYLIIYNKLIKQPVGIYYN